MISQVNNNITQTRTLKHQNKNNNQNNSPNFKSAMAIGSSLLNFLNTSPAIGACFLDFSSMAMPRTIVDSSRGFDAGLETGIRESSGTINHALAGLVGLGAGWLVSAAFNKLSGIKTHFIFTDGKAIDTFSEFLIQNKTNNTINETQYFANLFKEMEFLNTTTAAYKNNVQGAFTKLEDSVAQQAAELLSTSNTKKYKAPKNIIQQLKELIVGSKGSSEVVRLRGIEDTLENHINNAFSIKQAFKDKLNNDILNAQTGKKILTDAEFITKIKGLKKYTAALGLTVPVAIGMATQPVNRYLTKKRTGSDGFVGVDGREPDKSKSFKIAKIILGLSVGTAMISTILKNPVELFKPSTFNKAIKEIGSKLQYKGLVPTIDQFKFIYGLTIMSRLFAVRDKNEMRESSIKDILGFANWLILGGFVSKIVAKIFNNDTLNYDAKSLDKSTLWNKIKNSYIFKGTEKSHEEIIYPALKKLNINLKEINEDKVVPFKKLVEILKEHKDQPVVQKALKQLRTKNYQQLAGYLYSGIVLGYGIPKLNIAITKMCEKNKKLKQLPSNNDKLKISNEFIKKSAQRETKAFGAFLNAI